MFSQPSENIKQFYIDPGMHVADLGSGSGHYVIEIAKAVGHNGKVYAVDIQQDLLSRITKQIEEAGLRNVKTIWGDLEHLRGTSIRDMAVDRVVFSNVLFQVEHKDVAIQEAARILKPRGQLLFIDWSDSFGGLGPTPDQILSPYDAKDLFEANGFDFDRDIHTGDHHYGIVFRRHG